MAAYPTHRSFKEKTSDDQVRVGMTKAALGFQKGERIWLHRGWLEIWPQLFETIKEKR